MAVAWTSPLRADFKLFYKDFILEWQIGFVVSGIQLHKNNLPGL